MKKIAGKKKVRETRKRKRTGRISGVFGPLADYWNRHMEHRRLNQKLLTGAREGDLEGVKSALDKGADINARDILGRIALSLAESSGNEEVCNLVRSRMHLIPPLTKKEVNSILKENGLM